MKKLLTLALFSLASLSASAQNIYGMMETWYTYTAGSDTLERPEGWNGSDSVTFTLTGFPIVPVKQIFKETSNVHGGSAAAMLMTRDLGTVVGAAGITNGTIAVDIVGQTFEVSGGTPVTQRIAYLNAWIDYQPRNADEGSATIQAVLAGAGVGGADSVVGEGFFTSDGTSGYEGIAVQVTYIDANVVPDMIKIGFFSSSDLTGGQDSSTMYVDDVTISTVSVKEMKANSHTIKCYPNPATDLLHLRSMNNETLTCHIYNLAGQEVLSRDFTGYGEADLSKLTTGMYFYTVSNASGEVLEQQKLVIQ